MSRKVRNRTCLLAASVVGLWCIASPVSLVRAGSLDPEGPPGPTMKPVDQLEPRVPIFAPEGPGFPIVIDQPGSYYLLSNIVGAEGHDGIHITVDDVTLDLNGFTLRGVEGSLNGITVPLTASPVSNIFIHGGTVRDWGGDGICARSPCGEASQSQYRDLRLDSNGGMGIRIGSYSIVTRVNASNNTSEGIFALRSTLINVVATGNGGMAGISVWDSMLRDSVSFYNNMGIFAKNSSVVNCQAQLNTHDGIQAEQFSSIVGNTSFNNGLDGDGAGIHTTLGGNRIEGNNVTANDRGIDVDHLGSIIIKNSASSNTTDYDIAAGNTVGQIIDCTAGCTIAADPWANFRTYEP